jgi:hypothetical protein
MATADKGAARPAWLGAMMASMHDVYTFQGTCTSGHLTIQQVAVSSRPSFHGGDAEPMALQGTCWCGEPIQLTYDEPGALV